MGLISGLLLFPITGPLRGIEFILEQLQQEADYAMADGGSIQAELYEISLRRDLGEISDDEYMEREAELLEQLNAIFPPNEGSPPQQDTLEDDE